MLTIITPTGARPEAFGLCEKMMVRQTYKGLLRWIVVDDGPEPTPLGNLPDNWERIVIRPQPFWAPGQNTQGRNLLAGLDAAEALANEPLRLTVVEDDDWTHPDWLSHMDTQLDRASLVGEGRAIYYNVLSRRWSQLNNETHASLRATGMRGAALVTFREVLKVQHRYYDLKLWRAHQDCHVFFSQLTVGIKGMPGRPGIAIGHDGFSGKPDPNFTKLRALIGDDANWYTFFFQEQGMNTARYVVGKKPLRYPRPNGPIYQPGQEIVIEKSRDIELLLLAKKITYAGAAPRAPEMVRSRTFMQVGELRSTGKIKGAPTTKYVPPEPTDEAE